MNDMTEAQQWTSVWIVGVILAAMLVTPISCFWQKDFPKHVAPIQGAGLTIALTAAILFTGFVWGATS